MKRLIALAALWLATAPALAADYDKTEKSPLSEIRLRVPAAAVTIAPLWGRIMALYKSDADEARTEAKEDRESNPGFQPYSIDISWRVTFENDSVISLSADTYADTGAAHPGGSFQTLVWDKKTSRAVAINELFAPGQAKAALAAIADAAARAWGKVYAQRSGQEAGPQADLARDGIGPDAGKLKTYALTRARGETAANGIVLLYGAGQVWPHVLGEFRLAVSATTFARYLAPQWRPVFAVRS